MPFYDLNDMPFVQKRDNVFVKPITGERVQMLLMQLKPGEETHHSHPHEQMGLSWQVGWN